MRTGSQAISCGSYGLGQVFKDRKEMSNSGTWKSTVDSQREKESRIIGSGITLALNRDQSPRIKNKHEIKHPIWKTELKVSGVHTKMGERLSSLQSKQVLSVRL